MGRLEEQIDEASAELKVPGVTARVRVVPLMRERGAASARGVADGATNEASSGGPCSSGAAGGCAAGFVAMPAFCCIFFFFRSSRRPIAAPRPPGGDFPSRLLGHGFTKRPDHRSLGKKEWMVYAAFV